MTSLALAVPSPHVVTGQVDRPVAASATGHLPALDGLRGLMTLFVLISHYFGEVPSGPNVLCIGWVAVHMFFVLSGFLVGRLVIRKHAAVNFLSVFMIRRATRTLPVYFVCCGAIFALLGLLEARAWVHDAPPLPAWSYAALLQNIFVVTRASSGQPWLAPTWTLAVEEQFYLLAPWLFLLVPRRAWIPGLCTVAMAGLLCRVGLVLRGAAALAPISLLPTCADVLTAGLLLAVVMESRVEALRSWLLAIRIAPIACLFGTFTLQQVGDKSFQMFGPTLMAAGCAFFILGLLLDAPEARRFHAPVLRFFSRISYAVYLTHLAVLGMVHGFVLGTRPDIGTASQWMLTLAAVPTTIGVAWLLTMAVEQPLTAWGRGFSWR